MTAMAHHGKTNKALLKRIKITSTGKIFKRRNHQNHFNSKEGSNTGRYKRHPRLAPKELINEVKALIPNR